MKRVAENIKQSEGWSVPRRRTAIAWLNTAVRRLVRFYTEDEQMEAAKHFCFQMNIICSAKFPSIQK